MEYDFMYLVGAGETLRKQNPIDGVTMGFRNTRDRAVRIEVKVIDEEPVGYKSHYHLNIDEYDAWQKAYNAQAKDACDRIFADYYGQSQGMIATCGPGYGPGGTSNKQTAVSVSTSDVPILPNWEFPKAVVAQPEAEVEETFAERYAKAMKSL